MSIVVGVRTDDGREFVVDPKGVQAVPAAPKETKLKAGQRVLITKPEKCFPKSDELASALSANKWALGVRPPPDSAGVVLSTSKHPARDGYVAAVRVNGEGAQPTRDFVMDLSGVSAVTSISKSRSVDSRVLVSEPDLVLPNAELLAKQLGMKGWKKNAALPGKNAAGVVLGSVAHPVNKGEVVVGVKMEGPQGAEVLLMENALGDVPQESKTFKIGQRVRMASADRVFPRMDDLATQIGLGKWKEGAKPKELVVVEMVEEEGEKTEEGEGEPPKKKVKHEKRTVTRENGVGVVKGSAPHPGGSCVVVGVRMDVDGCDFLVAEDALTAAPSASKEFPLGSRVLVETNKVYPKWDGMADTLQLGKWVAGTMPATTPGKSTTTVPATVVGTCPGAKP